MTVIRNEQGEITRVIKHDLCSEIKLSDYQSEVVVTMPDGSQYTIRNRWGYDVLEILEGVE